MITFALTAAAMLAFAGNSILCRWALDYGLMDAASFTTVRILSGAAVLALIVLPRHSVPVPRRHDWLPAAMLFCFMACFSFAYLTLSAATGALILFGVVQITMISQAVRSGETLTTVAWTGFGVALLGLAWLVSPGATAPDPTGALLMAGAGIAWGIYALLSQRDANPILGTARNFLLAMPMALILSLALFGRMNWTWDGITLAVASGGITSGLGYVVWYAAAPRLSTIQGASVQLIVPIIVAALGLLLLSEAVTERLMLACALVLCGVGIVTAQRAARAARSDNRKTPA